VMAHCWVCAGEVLAAVFPCNSASVSRTMSSEELVTLTKAFAEFPKLDAKVRMGVVWSAPVKVAAPATVPIVGLPPPGILRVTTTGLAPVA
jgi:hypothetical protein